MTTSITLHSNVTVTKEQVSCDLVGQAVVLNLTNGLYFELNSVGARIWELLQDGRTVLQVRDILLEEYEVDAELCTADLLNILTDLADANLVRVVS